MEILSECALWSNNAYTLPLDSEVSQDGKTFYLHGIKTDAQALVIQEYTRTVVAFRGSTTSTDWLHDFKIWRTTVKYLKKAWVHSGFIQQYDELRNNIRSKIQVGKPVICTGHSLGGALATVATLDLDMNPVGDNTDASCYTFGSPRVGSKYFVKLFNKHVETSIRCVYKKDPITFTPLPIRFRHVKGIQRLNEKGIVKHLSSCAPSFLGCRIKHHDLNIYIKNLDK